MSNTTKLYLFNGIKIPRGFLDTINFDNIQQQQAYFQNHSSIIFQADNFSPIHEQSQLQVEGDRTLFEQANYLAYLFEDKWYYAFVNGMTQENYNSDTHTGTITIEYELELMQCYLFQVKALTHLFTIRRHLPNDITQISPRIYDELSPLYKNFAKTTKVGAMINGAVVKWVILVSKRKDVSITTNGELNPFSMFCFPVLVDGNGFQQTVAPCTVNGSPWGIAGVNDTIQIITGNTATGNVMTNNVVNLYTLDDVPITWTIANNTIVVNDTNATFQTDPTNIIQINHATNSATEQLLTLENLKTTLWGLIANAGGTESQLLNSTLAGISIANSYGSMDLSMKQLMPMNDFKLLKRDYATEQGSTITTLNNYMGNNLIAVQMGIKSTGKAQTILSNSTATYLQANKNSFQLKKDSLDLQQSQMNASQALQSSNLAKNISFGQQQNNINYGTGGDIAFYGQQAGQAINGVVGGVMGGVLGGGGLLSVAGGLAGAVTSGANIYQNVQNRNLQEKRDTYSLQYQQQAVNLQQQQAQQNMDMSRKAFIAENADRALQPLTINQMGVSSIADYANQLYCDNIIYWVSDSYSIRMANYELQRDGSYTADYYDLSDMLSTRPNFNKIQIAQRISLSLNQALKEMIEGALTKGVRFWNFGTWGNQTAFDSHFMSDYNCDSKP